jgi:hypothetical protein
MRRGKKLSKKLETRIKQWDSFPKSVQEATTRPGSEHK